jgi:hypothetical protein
MQANPLCGGSHHGREFGSSKWRHRIVPRPSALKYVAAWIEFALNVARLTGHADFVFYLVVIWFQFLQAERPVLDG